MNSKEAIFRSLKQNITQRFARPSMHVSSCVYADKVRQFIEMSKTVGAEAHLLKPGETTDDVVVRLFPQAKRIACNFSGIRCATFNPDFSESVRDLDGTDLVICHGIFGVCENAAVYFEQEYLQRAIYFISESLVFLLPKDKLVDTMHDAYQRISNEHPKEFRGFMSGPSKTADIEQALVMGAHGPRNVVVLLG